MQFEFASARPIEVEETRREVAVSDFSPFLEQEK